MAKWYTLNDYPQPVIAVGSVFRLPAAYPYESVVDFLVFNPREADYGLGLMVSSGYKAGLTLVILPLASQGTWSQGIDKAWLIANWSTWVYPPCTVDKVWLCPQTRTPRLPRKIGQN
ncbi:Imm45 family immunity protein [Agitococcus lubricus]|uniref:Immunity protein 45 of polymorphic toxin system n=1 Tax=Agitococcus lubricus TaxID=1077255 RepID=A0A2T5J2X5_9GAMM|nr:Imm45 family immunity protein [Agitococcus lubricus]PTQ90961.1 immunity protein 45 of polymorphic toxin system [Agitococcus lubricus]